MMIPFLKFSYAVFPNYGVAIILLTILVKMAFFPLTQRQFIAMKRLSELQPQMKAIQEKYKKEPERLQKELVEFYKVNSVNPFGGCLPLLFQLPFFFAIYITISSKAFSAMIHAPGIFPGLLPFWVANLSVKDGTFILPILIGIATALSQRLSTIDPAQARILMFMPVIMVVISINMPSGVLLYWVVSAWISYAQQWIIQRSASSSGGATKLESKEKLIA